jgi:exo-beta-1,3-glucanase (GH17 family)/cellulose synthase/poly-beta-1,6-N-acetylglucosamine synthase-like glycosyltransferase
MSIADTVSRRTPWMTALTLGLVVALMNLAAWYVLHGKAWAPDHSGLLAGIAYNGADRWQSPLEGERPNDASIARDLALLAPHTRRIRTYSADDHPALPAMAQQQGLELMLGAFLDQRLERNQRELAVAIELARSHDNIKRLIVGNETQLTAKLPPNRLIGYLEQVRSALQSSQVQVSTAEPWHVWLAQPQMAQHVDFIAVHVLPYWEGESIDSAVQTSMAQIRKVQARFPDKPVLVAEIGWPSNGQPVGKARATPANQARFIRGFLQEAKAHNIDYFLIEAFDQPWKIAAEGRAGPHWGLWDTWRQAKFQWSGPILADPLWQSKSWASSLLGLALCLPFLLAAPKLRLAGRLALCVAAQAIGSLVVILLAIPLSHYLTPVNILGLVMVLTALSFISATLLAQAFEFAERFWPRPPPPVKEQATPVAQAAPFVSLHLACANEPPDMVMASVRALLAIDWPALEVIVVDNNTRDPQARQVLANWAASCGDARLRFAQFEQLSGFKSGALNQALALTHPDAQWVAVVDADYMVDPAWLRVLSQHMQDPSVGLIQAPQAHRQWDRRAFDRMMNWETEGFFRIGMHHRHERNAIIQHGTLCLVRATDLRRLRWNEDCICEDTELGLRLLREGYRAVYVDRVLGTGLLPGDWVAYARQRRRWALGAMQILRLHSASLFGRSPLTLGQRYHFLAGWLPWMGDALHLLFSVVMVVFSMGMLYWPKSVEPPLWLFVAPLIAFFAARLLSGPLLYARCVPCGLVDRLGAAVAGMALSHRIARGVIRGLRKQAAEFQITRKSSTTVSATEAADTQRTLDAYKGPPFARGIEEELALLAGLGFCIGLLALSRSEGDTGRLGWIAILFIQSLPYWAALVCRLVERSGAARKTNTPAAAKVS